MKKIKEAKEKDRHFRKIGERARIGQMY